MAHHLTLEERDRIAQLRHQGADQKEIAAAAGRCASTISRELRRDSAAGGYYAAQAQWKAERRRQERPLVRKMDDPEINETVRTGLAREWSPEQIDERIRQQESDHRVSSQTIYTWIKQDEDREHWESLLRRRGKRPNRRNNAIPTGGDAARIDKRPEVIEARLRLGDFEGDTVLGSPGTGGLATLIDRKSRLHQRAELLGPSAAEGDQADAAGTAQRRVPQAGGPAAGDFPCGVPRAGRRATGQRGPQAEGCQTGRRDSRTAWADVVCRTAAP